MTKIRNLLLLGLFGIIVSGCAAVVVGGVAAVGATGAAVGTDPRSNGTVVNDNTIQAKLAAKYGNSDDFPDSNIYVDVYAGEVLLTGQVKTNELKNLAENVARGYPGVIKLYDYLDVRLPSSATARSKDSLITTQVKAELFGTSKINSNNIKVETTNTVVYLMGMVTPQEGESAAYVASKVGGVTKVVTLFQYTQPVVGK